MATTSVSILDLPTGTARVALGPIVNDPRTIKDCLLANYPTLASVATLLNGGDITSLGNTVAQTTFSGSPAIDHSVLDREETPLEVADFNFIYFADKNRWTLRRPGIGGYQPL